MSLNPLKSGQGFYTAIRDDKGHIQCLNPLKSGQGFYSCHGKSKNVPKCGLNPLKSGQGFY